MSAVRSPAALVSLSLSLVVSLPGLALAQTLPPRACASSAVASLVPTSRYTPVSAVMTGPDTLWVLYGDHDARNIDAVSLIEVRGIANSHLEVETHEIGEGTVTGGSLAVIGTNIVAAWVQTDHRVGVYTHPTSGGVDRRIAFDTTAAPATVSVTATARGGLVAWDDGGHAIHTARLDANGAQQGFAMSLVGRFVAPVTTSAFDGLVVFQTPLGRTSHLRVYSPGSAAPVPLRGAVAVGGVSGTTIAATPLRALVSSVARGALHVTSLDAANGSGRDRVLTPTRGIGEAGLGATTWGAMAAWTRAGSVYVVPVAPDGSAASAPFEVTQPATPEGARTPVVASTPQMAAVVWWGIPERRPAGSAGTLRFVRLDCH
ncbi:MAG: hypothetical protein WCJ30_23125 [Deltaproteobacteria bacterium]